MNHLTAARRECSFCPYLHPYLLAGGVLALAFLGPVTWVLISVPLGSDYWWVLFLAIALGASGVIGALWLFLREQTAVVFLDSTVLVASWFSLVVHGGREFRELNVREVVVYRSGRVDLLGTEAVTVNSSLWRQSDYDTLKAACARSGIALKERSSFDRAALL